MEAEIDVRRSRWIAAGITTVLVVVVAASLLSLEPAAEAPDPTIDWSAVNPFDRTRLSLYDGYTMHGGRRAIDGTVFRVSTGNTRGQVLECTVPDSAVAPLPLDVAAGEPSCRDYGVTVRELDATKCAVRVIAARHDGLLAEYTFVCAGAEVRGRGVFEIAGRPRDDVWSFPPKEQRSPLRRLVDNARHAVSGIF